MRSCSPCGIRQVDLSAPLSDLVCEDGEESLLAIFRWDGFALGRRLFTRAETPVPAAALAAIGATEIAAGLAARGPGIDAATPGALARHVAAAAATQTAPVSVIVCTRDRIDSFRRCLASLTACDPAPDQIVIVDNAPGSGDLRAIVEAVPGAVYVAEPRPGLSRARNAGILAATGEIVVFTDDDVEVEPNWLAPIRAAFADPATGCVTGQVLPADLSHPAAFSFEFDYGGLGASPLPRSFGAEFLNQHWGEPPPVWQIGAGANMAIRARVINEVGPFDERLGAGASGCSEDSEFFHRALVAGWLCRYEPLAAVTHHHRPSLATLRAQMRAYLRGHVVALLFQYGQTRHPGNLMRVFVGLPWHMSVSALRLALRPSGLRRRVYPWELLGFLEGPFSWLRRCRAEKFDLMPEYPRCRPVQDDPRKT